MFPTHRPIALAALAAAALVAAPAASHAELLTNPGFEDTDGDGNFGDGWGAFGDAGFNAFFGPANGHASLFLGGASTFGGVFQQGINATPGTGYTFTLADTRVESNANANLRFGLEFYNADETVKISESIAPIDLSNPAVNHGDGLVFTTTGTAPAGAVFVRPIVLFNTPPVPFGQGQENVFVFDASLNAVPEPCVALGTAGLAGLMLRRRRA